MKNLILCLIIFGSFNLQSQSNSGLVLEYNLHTDEVVYKMNGEVTTDPFIEVNENIKVLVTEFNPYITKATLKVENLNYNQATGAVAAGQLSGYSGGGMDGISSLLGGFSMGGDILGSLTSLPGSRGAASMELMQMKSNFTQLSAELGDVEEKINKSYEKIQLIKQNENSKKLALNDINNLKINPNIKPSRVKELIEEEIRYAFAKNEGEEIDIDDLINEMDKEKEIKESISNYMKAKEEYERISKRWTAFNMGVSTMSIISNDPQINYIKNSADSISRSIKKNVNKFGKLNLDADNAYDVTSNNLSLSELRQVYEEIQNNNFTYSFAPIQADGDEVLIDITISRLNKDGTSDAYKNLQQRVPVSGGWKVSGSLGLCFGAFQNQSYSYSVVGETIVADELDDFVPIVASFAHFINRSHKSLSFGGSFGVGFPLLGDEVVQSASFFLGPTVVAGKNQKLMITAGLMNAKINRLSQAYNVGDSFSGPTELLPLTKKYELGYFLGISFNLIN